MRNNGRLCLILIVTLVITWAEVRADLFTVNTTADTEDPNDGLLSLREAVNAANANVMVKDTIEFEIAGTPPYVIMVGNPSGFRLPDIVDPVVIDGTSQPGYIDTPVVVLDGTNVIFVNTYKDGLHLEGNSAGSEIRGLTVRFFSGRGVSLYVSDCTIEGNIIQGNGGFSDGLGILISLEEHNDILDNIVSGNQGAGVKVAGDGNFGQGQNLIKGNRIVGNTQAGVAITSQSNQVYENVISDNDGAGITLHSYWAADNVVRGNFIGTDQNGAILGNGHHGIWIAVGNDNMIGGFDFRRDNPRNFAANVIAHNQGDGVYVQGTAVNNTIRGNSIFENLGLGIDLGEDGVDNNDDQDGDSGSNFLQNYPKLIFATANGNSTTVRMKFSGQLATTYHFDFYANDQVDPSGNGEGKTYLSSFTVTTPLHSHTLIADVTLPAVPAGKFITATATDYAGNTSEFSDEAVVKARSKDQR